MTNSTASRLDSLIGLGGAKRAVLRLAQPGSGVHAVLLYGAEGAGKESLAEALAQAWLCTSPTEVGACGVCPACESFGRDRSADLLRIAPKGSSDWIRTFAITETDRPEDQDQLPLIEFFRTQPLRARHKVARIVRADRLYPDAANAFLKTLEEPHPYAKIVMTTSEIGRMLPTIVSRCVSIACELPTVAELTGFKPVNEDLLALSEGAPGRLLHISEHGEIYGKIAGFASRLSSARAGRALALAEQFRGLCEELDGAIHCGARQAHVEGLRSLAAALSSEGREDWLLEIAEAHRRVQMNGSAAMVLDAMFARMLV